MLPYSMNTNYVNGIPVEPADLNDLQESVVDLYTSTIVVHGLAGVPFDVPIFGGGSAGVPSWSRVSGAYPSGYGIKAVQSVHMHYAFPVPVGRRVNGAAAVLRGNASATAQVSIYTTNYAAPNSGSDHWAFKAFTPATTEQVCAVGSADVTPQGIVLPVTITTTAAVVVQLYLDPGVSVMRVELRLV